MPKDDVAELRSLGAGSTQYQKRYAPEVLEFFPSKVPSPYLVEFRTSEFTSLCPKTGQPDFGEIRIQYIPRDRCVESKSLKLYLGSFRNEGMFMETIVGTILDDLKNILDPIAIRVIGAFASRGGIETLVVRKSGTNEVNLIPDW